MLVRQGGAGGDPSVGEWKREGGEKLKGGWLGGWVLLEVGEVSQEPSQSESERASTCERSK